MTRRRALPLLAATYLVLLAASHVARRSSDTMPKQVPAGLHRIALDDTITIAYREHHAARSENLSPVLLLHGSPGSSHDFSTLAPSLAGRFRVIAPDLPGFGHSTRHVPDYSIRAHARYVLAFLDRLGVESVHVLGFSMGGGVAIEIARQAPDRLSSLILLSSIGVQELELTGNYRLNHAIHWLQLAALTALYEGVPHFGLLDGLPLDLAYARNFYDSDQRPLRATLEAFRAPVLVLHGKRDLLVPVAAAREHSRLVPQSELVLLDASHFIVFRGGDRLAVPITDFLARVEKGEARVREQASSLRLSEAKEPFDVRALPRAGGAALAVLMVLLALATFASEDLASIGTGLLVSQGRLGFFAGAVACFVGILVGDVAIYLAGRFLGRPWLRRAPLRWILSPNAVRRGERWFARRGPSIIFTSRFLPGTRVATYFAAGLLATGFWRFFAYLCLAVCTWVPLIVGLTALLGVRMFNVFDAFSRIALPGIVGLAIIGWLVFRLLRATFTSRGRRLLLGSWLRIRRWEFWPPWVFYVPVLAHALRLAVRYRSLTIFCAANPAMPAGGVVGESKAAILAALDPRFVARYTLVAGDLPLEDKQASLERFVDEFPVVLKPDVGQRGRGVVVARDLDTAVHYLGGASGDVLLQEFVPGPELGVFYVRPPVAERGYVFSITDKRLPTIEGDGTSTIEELILADRRAVAMASVYFEHLAPELERVPAPGESVQLIDVGTHCRGALFLDGGRFRTPDLEAAVEEISRSFTGFHFGRYDLKSSSYEAFKRGDDITVLELNGVTSEATHIYDPGNSLPDAYRVLFRQWELAFDIGRQNVQSGAAGISIGELLRIVIRSLSHNRG